MTVWLWIGFIGFLAGLAILDFGLLSRKPRAITVGEARASVALWALAAVGCAILVHVVYDNDLFIEQAIGRPQDGANAALQFITAFIVEVSLSLENLAVMALLITYFRVDPALRSRLLFLAILASLLLRAGLIFGGVQLLGFSWTPWLFAFMLLVATWRLLVMPDETSDLEHKWLVRTARRIPAVPEQRGQSLFTREPGEGGGGVGERGPRSGRMRATPLMVAFLAAAAADFSLALDSVPAVFAITRDPFIAFASNALAIMTMRSLYFALPHIGRLRYMKVALAVLMLAFAVKILLKDEYGEIYTAWTLIGVCVIMVAAVGVSLWKTSGELTAAERPPALADAAEALAVTRRNLRKIVILIVGTFILCVAAPLVGLLPGPGGIVVAAAGLGILATEFIWARRLLNKLKDGGQFMQKTTDTIAAKTPFWLPPLVIGLLGWSAWELAHHVSNPKFVYLPSIGFFMVLAYWAYASIAAAIKRRRSPNSPPPTSPGPASPPEPPARP